MRYNSFFQAVKEIFLGKKFSMTELDKKREARLVRFVLVAMAVLFVTIEPSIALADGGGVGGLERMVKNIVTTLTGPMGKGLATIAIMVLGIMAMFGKLEWGTAVKVIIGIAVTFGAASVVKLITGNGEFETVFLLPNIMSALIAVA